MTFTAMKEVVSGVALVLLGSAVLWAMSDFATGVTPAADPALLPRVVAFGLIISGGVLVAGSSLRRRTADAAAGSDGTEGLPVRAEVSEELRVAAADRGRRDWWVTVAVIVLITAYAVAAFRVGFITCTVLFIAGGAMLLGRHRSLRSMLNLLLFAALVCAAIYIGFFELLNVRVPATPLP